MAIKGNWGTTTCHDIDNGSFIALVSFYYCCQVTEKTQAALLRIRPFLLEEKDDSLLCEQ